jgi:2-methylcitrate dehydratase PrpD
MAWCRFDASLLESVALVMREAHLTADIATYLSEASFEKIPSKAIEVAKLHILDCLGVAAAGAREPAARIVSAFVSAEGGVSSSTIIAGRLRTPASSAALANGTSAHVLDFDDTHHPGFLHPSAVLVPAILSLAEERKLSGRQVITAYLFGLDVMAALASRLNPVHYERGWHATSTIGSLMAVSACSVMLGLGHSAIVNGLAIAATMSSGIRRNFGTMTKAYHAGMAARNGVVASKLAEAGLTGDSEILEGDRGFLDLFSSIQGHDAFGILDHTFKLAVNGLAIKQFASCGATHPPIEAMLQIRHESAVTPETVDEIAVTTHPMLKSVLTHDRPENGLEGKFSLPHCMAVSLIDGAAGLGQFTDDRVKDPMVRELASRVRHMTDPTVGLTGHMSWGAIVDVGLRDGRRLTREVDVAKGKWMGDPFTPEEVTRKFLDCADVGGITRTNAADCSSRVLRLEDESQVTHIMTAIAG